MSDYHFLEKSRWDYKADQGFDKSFTILDSFDGRIHFRLDGTHMWFNHFSTSDNISGVIFQSSRKSYRSFSSYTQPQDCHIHDTPSLQQSENPEIKPILLGSTFVWVIVPSKYCFR